MDNVNKAARSEIMKKIKSKDTKPEKWIEALLKKNRIYHIKHDSDLPGKPDFFIPGKGAADIVILVDGCFWHCCPDHWRLPKSNIEFWLNKFQCNVERDKRNNENLLHLKLKVVRVWECSLKRNPDYVIARIMKIFKNKTRKVYYVENKTPIGPPAVVEKPSRRPRR